MPAREWAWRPSELTDEKVNKLEEAFLLDCTIDEACFLANISKPTYYRWIEVRPELVTRFEACRNSPVLLARQEVIKWFKDNPELALKYLERKRKNEFSTRQELDLNWKLLIELTPEEKQQQEELLKLNN
jgi:hypothetical protein